MASVIVDNTKHLGYMHTIQAVWPLLPPTQRGRIQQWYDEYAARQQGYNQALLAIAETPQAAGPSAYKISGHSVAGHGSSATSAGRRSTTFGGGVVLEHTEQDGTVN